ncbi:MAG: FtsQ-type POTRA domain-containing protein [Lachnospiraceae bacterium]|nr:FtsQ-type POTRA domain-containing protein [Lachnospiraceae bacterium]
MFNLQNRKKTILILVIVIVILAAIGGAGWYVWKKHTIQTVYVEGNIHYTQEEICSMVMDGPFGNNSLYLSMKYKNRSVTDMPFLDEMDVKILTPDTIKITVYEKALAGYVKYMDTYIYFDKDGYVVESSSMRTQNIPQVTGLKFDYAVLGQPLPVPESEKDIFSTILELTKLLNKYKLNADKIYFHSNAEITVYFDKTKVALGNETAYLEDKLMCLPKMLTELGDRSGTIQMEIYNDGGQYTFKPD